eukprot:122531-Pyramimonas_sp.AAC.1
MSKLTLLAGLVEAVGAAGIGRHLGGLVRASAGLFVAVDRAVPSVVFVTVGGGVTGVRVAC